MDKIPINIKWKIHAFFIFQVLKVEMDVMKFKDNTMVCGCTTKITLIHGLIKLNYKLDGIRLEYYKDCVCDLLQILNLWMWPV